MTLLWEAVAKITLQDKQEVEKIIRSGKVMVNNEVIFLPSIKIKETDVINIKTEDKYVSRGAYKLLKAYEEFELDFKNKNILDIGSSTGGFTQVSLEKGANHVVSVDVGTNQLDFQLRSDKRVTAMEKTNIKDLTIDLLPNHIDIAVCDVSFISLKHVFSSLKGILKPEGLFMALIKPQFEAFRDQVEVGGIVDKKYHQEIIEKVKMFAKNNNFDFVKLSESPILGQKSKNIEYISLWKRGKDEY